MKDMSVLEYWVNLYQKNKHNTAAIDIETSKFNGDISVLGVCRRVETSISPIFQEIQLIKNKELSEPSIRWALQGANLILTYNGKGFDIPRIQKQFPNALPKDVAVLDLYLLAKQIGMSSDLKTLEKVASIRRPAQANQKGNTGNLWNQYRVKSDVHSLQDLLKHNKYDARNLFELAEFLVSWAQLKAEKMKRIHQAICESALPS